MKKNQDRKQRGFTLLELLIATAIFAVTILLVVGSFGLSTKNQREIRTNRDLSQNIRHISSEIARQIELSANGQVINYSGGVIRQNDLPVYNFAIGSNPEDNTAAADNNPDNYLFVRGADDHCRIYYLDNEPKQLAVKIDKNKGCKDPDWTEPFYLTDTGTRIKSLQFKGVMNTGQKEEYSYSWIIIKSENSDISEYYIPMATKTLAAIRNYGEGRINYE